MHIGNLYLFPEERIVRSVEHLVAADRRCQFDELIAVYPARDALLCTAYERAAQLLDHGCPPARALRIVIEGTA